MKTFFRGLTAIFFCVAGSAHFLKPEMYLKLIPPYIPFPEAANVISGFCEILFGIFLLFKSTREVGVCGLVLLLIAVFPANIYMTLHPEVFPIPHVPQWAFWLRLPLQAVLILGILALRDRKVKG